ncbi:SPOSA6832_03587 [Sporobolomyces salmonicolor]|uniref:SPOSA6832_03587-mRNA-1:cds n=1 Tax=Sporidiobolus salmonicolor TaxID=5005 RepID=A0A0D6EPQ1_SPOSA|nr:SPOSA6832_03587 [Sporobolomyces salmonicolor]
MKYIEMSELDVLSNALCMSTPTLKLTTRIEAYSCKQVSKERKLFKTLESELIQDISHSTSVSPPEHHQGLLDSAFGPLDKPQSRKTLWLLIGLLNVAFPDHDFSKVRPEDFRREEGPRAVLSSLSSALDHLRSPTGQRSFSAYPSSSAFGVTSSPYSDAISLPSSTPTGDYDAIPTNPFLRQVLDPIIDLAECEVFTYTPDMDSDPHAAESDDEEDDDLDDDAFERDDDGMAFEMEGVDGNASARSFSSYRARPSAFSDSSTPYSKRSPMKSISSVFPPGTPGSVADSEDYFAESSTGGLLWSTFQFLYNKKLKRIVFINAWARTPSEARPRRRPSAAADRPRPGPVNDAVSAHLKRSASTSSVASIPVSKKKARPTN